MGLVYRARHTVLNKLLAVKVLRPDVSGDEEIMKRFRQEAQSASAIGNQHIIDISDFGTLPDGATYFVMEYLDGQDLTGAIEGGALNEGRAIHIMGQLCRALAAAHEGGIVHRDLKPDNIFLIHRGDDQDFVKVLDFGIAKVGSGTQKLTKAGQVFGTPHYMSPEQCAGRGIDHRTDIYAMGVILYEMVCGRVPFDADNLMGVLTQHMYENPIPPRELPPPAASVSSGLEAVILKCLAKAPEGRYATAKEMLTDLQQVAQGGTPVAVMESVERQSLGGGDSVGQGPPFGPGRTSTTGASDSTGFPNLSGDPRMSLTMGDGTVALAHRRRGWVWGLVFGGVIVLSAAGLWMNRDGAGGEEAPLTLSPQAQSGEGIPPEVPVSDVVPARIEVKTVPDHASIWSGSELLGNAPLAVLRPTGEEKLELTLRMAGYKEQPVQLSTLTADEVVITLEKNVVITPSPATDRSQRPPTRRVTPSRPTPRPGTVTPTPTPAPTTRPTPKPAPSRSEVLDPWG